MNRALTTLDVESSEPDKTKEKDSPLLNRTNVNDALSQLPQLPPIPSNYSDSEEKSDNDIEELHEEGSESGKDTARHLSVKAKQTANQHEDDNLSLLKDELKNFIVVELNKIKRSIIYDLNKMTNEIKNAISVQGAKKSVEESPWKILDFKLPRETDEEFLELEKSLAEQTKQDALVCFHHVD